MTGRSARELSWPDLVWSHFSRPRFGGFDDRVRAAAEAGFAGIGLYAFEYERLRVEEGRSNADITAVLASNAVAIAEVEVIAGWWATEGPALDACRRFEALAFEMADAFGARYLQAIGPYDCSLEQAIDGFGALCDRAAAHGLLVGIEWLPFTNIRTAADAQVIVEGAARANGGYCADIWHHTRGANDLGMIEALDPAKVFAIQMSDGSLRQPTEPGRDVDYKTDCLTSRVPPGAGEMDCVGFLRTLRETGVDAPISLEVCNTELWAGPADVAARAAADGIRHVLGELARA